MMTRIIKLELSIMLLDNKLYSYTLLSAFKWTPRLLELELLYRTIATPTAAAETGWHPSLSVVYCTVCGLIDTLNVLL